MLDDLRWALRYAARRRGLATAIVATLAICIAAAATAFGLADAVLWRAMPFADDGRLVFVWEVAERDGREEAGRVTGMRYAAWRDAGSGLSSIALFGANSLTLDADGEQVPLRGVRVSTNFFDTLGVHPALGRSFHEREGEPGNHRVVILSHALWRQRFGGRPDAIGASVRLGGESYTVIGVMPPLTFPGWALNPAIVTLDPEYRQYWVPLQRTPALDRNGRSHVFGVVARLAPGVSAAQAFDKLNATSGPAEPHGVRLVPLREQFVRDARAQLLALFGAALAVLLIACANLGALQLSAFESRRAELGVRAAIGASVPKLVRQIAMETLLLAALGTSIGLALAAVLLPEAPALLPASIPFLTPPSVDVRVGLFAVLLAVIASAILCAWPVVRLLMSAPSPRGTVRRPRQDVYRTLVVAQTALTLALVAAAGLLSRSLHAVTTRDTGFAIERVLVADVQLRSASGADAGARIAAAEQTLLAAVAARPGVRAVAAAYDHPLAANWSENPVVSGESVADDARAQLQLRIVSPGYFEALEVDLLEGRTLEDRDTIDSRGVAVVNDAFARANGGRVLGRRIRSSTPSAMFANAPAEFEIVGVVEDERSQGIERPSEPSFYLSTRQFPQNTFSLLVRTDDEPLAIAGDVRKTIRREDPVTTFSRPRALEQILDGQMAERRVTTELIGGFAAVALLLAALGMYSLLAITVGSRRREIGVRLAIGAAPASVARRIVIDSLRTASTGVALGCVLALATGRLLESLLVDVSARDPLTLLAVASLMTVSAALASVLPARRAFRTSPIEALRSE